MLSGIKSDIAHGIGRAKAVTFASIPQVISDGRQIDFVENWKGREYDSYIFAAPVEVEEKRNYVAVVVLKDTDTNRFYLHEVVDADGNIVKIKRNNESEAFKTKNYGQARVTGATDSLSNNSISDNEKKAIAKTPVRTHSLKIGQAM